MAGICQAVREAAREWGEQVFIYQRDEETCRKYTYRELIIEVDALASSLSGIALSKGTRVAILSENRFEWIVAYLASVSLGLVVVPLDPMLSLSDWRSFLRHAEAEILFLSDRFSSFAENFQDVASLKRIILFDRFPLESRFVHSGFSRLPKVDENDVASIIYTSGTTGSPKGVLLSHGNLLSNGHALDPWFSRGQIRATILPLNHAFGFMGALATMLHGGSLIFYAELGPEILSKSFAEIRPHVIDGVPAFFDRMANAFEARMPPLLKRFLGKQRNGKIGERGTFLRGMKKRIFKKVHAQFGNRIDFCISGGSSLEPGVARFFNLLGIPVFEGYGLTETSPVISANSHQGYRLGSVGKPLKGIELKIDRPDQTGTGEICVKGPIVMKGYYKNPEATREVLDSDGYFHTGDLGYLDSEGFLFVSGRRKEVIVTANGKNIYPHELEHHFGQIKLIKELCVFGVDRRHPSRSNYEIVHLQIVPDFEEARQKGIGDAYGAIRQEVSRLSDQLPDYKRPRSLGFSITPFPRSANLKIKKFQVRHEWIEKQRFPERMVAQPSPGDLLLEGPVGSVVVKILKPFVPDDISVSSGSSFTLDLGLDSLTMLEFWNALGKAFGISIPEKKTGELKTVREVIGYLQTDSSIPQKAHSASIRLEMEGGAATNNWDEILEANAEKNLEVARTILDSYPRARPFFLKLFRKFFKYVSHLRVEGLENLPLKGPYILAPNHESHLDNLFVACFLPEFLQQNMVVIGKKEHFDHLVTRMAARLCHALPVDRGHVSNTVLQVCAQVLRQGRVLLVHPEGTRSPDGHLLPFKNGVAILANHLRCPVVPVYIEGAYEFWPKDSLFPKKRSDISVTIGKPLYPQAPVSEDKVSAASVEAEEFTAKLMESVIALSEGLKRSSIRSRSSVPAS